MAEASRRGGAIGWLTAAGILLSPAAHGQDAAPGKSASLFRQAEFKRSALEMTTCAATLMELVHPELHYITGPTTAEWKTLGGATKDDVEDVTWAIVARDSGNRSSEVRLLGLGASNAELDEIWQVLKPCETQK